MLKLNNLLTALLLVLAPALVFGQFSKPQEKFVNEEQYIYPVYPGKPGSLAGTMGELRATHFHSGIDIRTNNMIGLPVLAAKSGFISRITTGPSGYGNIIYITHPDGNTTLYAHLDKFKGPIARHVLQEQYNKKNSAVDLYFTPEQFTVKQGDTIALSGNSGSSSGPHLHFDIRDPNNLALDPLTVANFPEVPDNLPPAAEKIAVKTLDINSRINDKFGRFEFHALAKSGNNYSIASPILASGLIGIELVAKDRLAPGSAFYGGVNYIDVLVDSQLVFSQQIEKVDVAETRAIYTVMDFKTMRAKGSRFYKLYIDDGNNLKFYNNSPGTGKIKINPDKESSIRIVMRDSYNNKSTVSFKIRPSPVVKEVITLESFTGNVAYELSENTFMVTTKPCSDSTKTTSLFVKGKALDLTPDYYNKNRAVYLVDLRKHIPDSISLCNTVIYPNIKDVIPSGTEYKYYGDYLDVSFPNNALYDTLYFGWNYNKSTSGIETFTIGDRTVPLHKSITITLKSAQTYAKDQGIGIYRIAGKGHSYVGRGEWNNGNVTFNTREFGEFVILEDRVAPTITPLNVDRASARFKIRDNLSGIDSFEANINGSFLLMHYDAKTATIWSEQLNKKIPLSGNFELTVLDNAGNKSIYTKKIP